MPHTTHSEFDADQDFDSIKDAIKLIHAQANPMVALKAIVCANVDRDELGFAAELLHAYHPACALDDPKFRAQMQGLQDMSAALNGTQNAPVVSSTEKAPSLCPDVSAEVTSECQTKKGSMDGPTAFLNPVQIDTLRFYASCEFAYLLELSNQAEFDKALQECGDTLLRFLVVELSTGEDCNSVECAFERLSRTVSELRTVHFNLEELAIKEWS